MPVTKAISIEVIGNKVVDYHNLRYSKLKTLKVKPKNNICPECNLEMKPYLGIYDGYSYCNDEDDPNAKWYRSYSLECENFHHYSWSELIK